MSHDPAWELGTSVAADCYPPSRVVGIDRYVLTAFDGRTLSWTSYTLVSDQPGAFARWWIADVPGHGVHYFIAAEGVPQGAVFDPTQSGLVRLASEGDAALSAATGALAVYHMPDGTFYCEEVFDGAERLVFIGHALSSATR